MPGRRGGVFPCQAPDADESTLRRIRWAREGEAEFRMEPGVDPGQVASDWYCERTYESEKHKYQGRGDCQAKLGSDQAAADRFREKRDELIQRRASGKQRRQKSHPKDSRKQRVLSRQKRESRLLPPKPKFYTMEQYKDVFKCDPKKNKEHGHKVTQFGKFRGVVVPAKLGDGNEPWDVEVAYCQSNELETEDAVKDSQDSDDIPEELQDMYNDIVDREDEAFHKAVVGTSYEELMAQLAEEANNVEQEEPADAGRKFAEDWE